MATVYVTGAGCTKGAGFKTPLANEIFKFAADKGLFRRVERCPRMMKVLADINIQVEELKKDNPQFEQFLDRISKHSKQLLDRCNFDLSPVWLLKELRQVICNMQWDLFHPLLHFMMTKPRTLLDKLSEKVGFADSVISFNYDTLFEIALHRAKKLDPIFCYQLDFTKYMRADEKELVSTEGVKRLQSIPFLKLHGSINWFKNRNSPELAVIPACHMDAWSSYDDVIRYSNGGENSIMLIVAAADKEAEFRKNPEVWPRLWEQSLTMLSNACEIVIIGYSLPDYDSSAIELFRNASNSPRRILQKVNLVDPSKSVREKYKQIFGKGLMYREYPGGLQEFLKCGGPVTAWCGSFEES